MTFRSPVASICFGAHHTRASDCGAGLELALPVLAGDPVACIPLEVDAFCRRKHWDIWSTDGVVCAQGLARVAGSPAEAARRLYEEAFEIAGDFHLYRFWNFIPCINRKSDGMEHYRSFGLGRHQAFVKRFGPEDAAGNMPAATGVGIDDDKIAVVLIAGSGKPKHYENPSQVPAYRYPPRYGPRPPSFARGTRVEIAGRTFFFLAGTSSVIGHESVATGDLARQIEITLNNLEIMGGEMGLPTSLGRGRRFSRILRVYLRRSSDLDTARSMIAERLLEPGDEVVWLKSDICRTDLDVEIDATVVG